MIALRQLQENLQAHLLTQDEQIAAEISKPTQDTVAERLAIYSHGYQLRLLEVLGVNYAMLAKLLGAEAFDQLGRAYIAAHPSRFFSVDQMGQYLSQFLATTAPYQQQLHLSELANLLWALDKTIDAVDAPVLTAQDLAAIAEDSWPEMRLGLHPSVQLLSFQHNTVALWQALTNDHDLPAVQQTATNYCVVWRKEIQPFYCVVNTEESWVLQALQQQRSFEEICEGLLQWLSDEEVAQYAVNLLLRWLNDGMLSSIKIS